jgi:hypothetical protein
MSRKTVPIIIKPHPHQGNGSSKAYWSRFFLLAKGDPFDSKLLYIPKLNSATLVHKDEIS